MTGQLQLVAVERGQQVGPAPTSRACRTRRASRPRSRIPETQTKDLGDRPEGGHRHAQRPRGGHVSAHRPGVARRHGRRGRHARGAAAGRRAAGPQRGRHDRARAPGQRHSSSRRPAFGQENGTRSASSRCWPDGEAVRTPVKLGRARSKIVEIVDGLQRGRPGDPLGHVAVRRVRTGRVELALQPHRNRRDSLEPGVT